MAAPSYPRDIRCAFGGERRNKVAPTTSNAEGTVMGRGSRRKWLCLALVSLAVAAIGALIPSVAVSRTSAQTVGGLAPSLSLAAGQQLLLDSEEQTFVALINEYRAKNGVPSLGLSPTLNNAARWMSEDMAANDHFDHTDSLGRNLFQRMADFGYSHDTWKGENLAAGSASASHTFELWRESSAHNGNMLSRDFVVIGVARAYDPDSTHGWYWTTDFGGFDEERADLEPAFDGQSLTSLDLAAVTASGGLQDSTPLRGGDIAEAVGAMNLVAGWNYVCYAGSQQGIDAALAPVMSQLLAVYRLRDDGRYDRWLAGRPEASTIATVKPFEPLLILLSGDASWVQDVSAMSPPHADLVRGWNSVCYGGLTEPADEAAASIGSRLDILYALGSDQVWRRYVPGRSDLTNIGDLPRLTSVLALVTGPSGATWTFGVAR